MTNVRENEMEFPVLLEKYSAPSTMESTVVDHKKGKPVLINLCTSTIPFNRCKFTISSM
jgi:hypothetical protein